MKLNLNRPSRLSKTQLVCYVDSKVKDELIKRSHAQQKNLQELLCICINYTCEKIGEDKVFSVGHEKLMHRVNKRAKPKVRGSNANRVLISGWFDQVDMQHFKALCKIYGMTVQMFTEYAILCYLQGNQFLVVYRKKGD